MEPLAARLLCARLVRESPAFFVRELRHAQKLHVYHLRGSDMRVAIRHPGDAATLAEVFYHRWYEPRGELARALDSTLRILDLGANIGLFGAFALTRWPQSRVFAYEPDPANVAVHRRTIEANELATRWTLEPAAAGVRDGEAVFAVGLNVDSHEVDPRTDGTPAATTTLPMRDVLAQMAAADLVKMDIEGGEWDILCDPRFANHPPPAIVLEYHPRHCPDADPRAALQRALEGAGLAVTSIWHSEDGHGMVWAWRS